MNTGQNFIINALNNLASAIWIVDADIKKTQFVNAKFRSLLSIPASVEPCDIDVFDCVRRLGDVFDSVIWHKGDTALALEKLRSTSNFEVVLPTCDGRHIKLDRFPNEAGSAVINFTDVTQLVEATQRAKNAETAKTAFLANMSHEIRTPMNGVIGMTQVLAMTDLDETQQNYVDLISRSGKALVSIINDILDFSKLESGKFTMHPAPFDLSEMIDDVVKLMGHAARDQSLELILDRPCQTTQKLVGDAGRLRQVMINLIGNALKFTQKGHVKVTITQQIDGGTAVLNFAVKDTGIGISEEDLKVIFKQFSQAEDKGAHQFGGTGLGLSISRQLVEQMGGALTAASRPGAGSTFSFSVKLKLSTEAAKNKPVYPKLSKTPILVIDDIPVNHLILSNQLSALGATPICVDNGPTALRVIDEAARKGIYFSLIISDYQMPNMNGLEFVDALRQSTQAPETPVMILTSADLSDEQDRIKQLRVGHVYSKPCLPEDLSRAVFEAVTEQNLMALNSIAQQHAPPAKPLKTEPMTEIKVLAAEDNQIDREVLTKLFENTPINLTLVQNGTDAVNRFMQDDFDVILMDISMYGLDGVQAAKKMRQIESRMKKVPTPIVAATARVLPEDKELILQAGINAHLSKPLDRDILCSTVFKWARAKDGARSALKNETRKTG